MFSVMTRFIHGQKVGLAMLALLVGLLAAGCSITASDNSGSDNNAGDGDTTGDTSGDGTGDDGSSGDTGGGTGDTITFLGASGAAVDAEGVWELCYQDSAGDFLERHTFTGTNLDMDVYDYTSTDGSCTGTETFNTEESITALTLTQGEDVTLAGWSAGEDLTDAPDAADGSGPLDDLPMASSVDAVATDVSGVLVRMIDDTGTDYLMYRDHPRPEETCRGSLNGTDYDLCLHAIDALVKVAE